MWNRRASFSVSLPLLLILSVSLNGIVIILRQRISSWLPFCLNCFQSRWIRWLTHKGRDASFISRTRQSHSSNWWLVCYRHEIRFCLRTKTKQSLRTRAEKRIYEEETMRDDVFKLEATNCFPTNWATNSLLSHNCWLHELVGHELEEKIAQELFAFYFFDTVLTAVKLQQVTQNVPLQSFAANVAKKKHEQRQKKVN